MPKIHEGKCGHCALCTHQSKGMKYKHFCVLKEDIKASLLTDENINLQGLGENSCICYTCFKRWERKKGQCSNGKKPCQIEKCPKLCHTSLVYPM